MLVHGRELTTIDTIIAGLKQAVFDEPERMVALEPGLCHQSAPHGGEKNMGILILEVHETDVVAVEDNWAIVLHELQSVQMVVELFLWNGPQRLEKSNVHCGEGGSSTFGPFDFLLGIPKVPIVDCAATAIKGKFLHVLLVEEREFFVPDHHRNKKEGRLGVGGNHAASASMAKAITHVINVANSHLLDGLQQVAGNNWRQELGDGSFDILHVDACHFEVTPRKSFPKVSSLGVGKVRIVEVVYSFVKDQSASHFLHGINKVLLLSCEVGSTKKRIENRVCTCRTHAVRANRSNIGPVTGKGNGFSFPLILSFGSDKIGVVLGGIVGRCSSNSSRRRASRWFRIIESKNLLNHFSAIIMAIA